MIPSNALTILSVLALLGTAGLVALAVAIALLGVARKQPGLTKLGAAGGSALLALYLVTLTGAGLLSREKTLPTGTEKYFCELDCHLAYSVTGLRQIAQVPRALGRVWAVTIRTRFDERTISSHRPKDMPLTPNPRRLALVTQDGVEHPPLEAGPEELARLGLQSVPLTRELIPGESYITTVLFDVPAASAPVALLLEDGVLVSRLLIGGEVSPFHARTLLALPEASLAWGR
jgi:hypothetical protein